MYGKLALRNVRRSVRDYSIYFMTLTLVAALMVAFLALGFSEDILSMTENMSMLRTGIMILSVMIALLAAFVVGVAIRFILGQRKKEFALYQLMGMEGRAVRRLFIVEHAVIGGAAFLLGSVLGIGLSGVLVQLVKRIFEMPHDYHVAFSAAAWGVALVLFALLYGVGIRRAVQVMRRQRVVELLYDNDKNETCRRLSSRCRRWLLMAAFLALCAGVGVLSLALHQQTNRAWLYLLTAVALLLGGVYTAHRHLPFLFYEHIKAKKACVYQNERLFLLGQVGRRLESAGRTMAVIAILLTASLVTMFAGLAMGAGYKANMTAYYPYDVGVAVDAPLTLESMNAVTDFVAARDPVADSLTYYLYTVPGETMEALALSDYNHLRQILGYAPVNLTEDAFMVHCDTWHLLEDLRAQLEAAPTRTIAGQRLTAVPTIATEPMEQYQMAGTKGAVLVLPDAVARALPAEKIRLVLSLADGGDPSLKQALRDFLGSGEWQPAVQTGATLPDHVTMGVTVKAWGVANSLTGFTAISFCGLYLSAVFIILSCAVLAFQQLSAIDKNRRHYQVLARLGVPLKRQAVLLRQEMALVFMVPLALPLLLTVLAIIGAQYFWGQAILHQGLILQMGGLTVLIFLILYGSYFAATLAAFKRVVFQGRRLGR